MILKPFLLAYDNYNVTRKSMLDYLDTRSEFKNWFACLPAGIVIISDRTCYQLAEVLRQNFPGLFFIITEIPLGSNDGWLDKKVWSFINNPVSSGRWPPFS